MVIKDNFSADTDTRALAVAAKVDYARKLGHKVIPLIWVKARACGCGLGEVHRIDGVTALIGTVRHRMPTRVVNARLHFNDHCQPYAVLLDEPGQMVQFGCEHGGTATGELFGDTLARIRAAVAAVRRPGVRLKI